MACRSFHNLTVTEKINIYHLKSHFGMSFRELEKKTSVAKSTLHYNANKLKSEYELYENVMKIDGKRFLVKLVLNCALDCQMSLRAISRMIKTVWNISVSRQSISRILDLASLETFSGLDYSKLKQCLTDEIFGKKGSALLGLVDPVSSYCYFMRTPKVNGESWDLFLENLQLHGFNPDHFISDGGSAMRSSINKYFPESNHIRDSFHILHYLKRAERAMQGHCMEMLDQLEKADGPTRFSKKTERLREKTHLGIELYDNFCESLKKLKSYFYIGDPEQYGRYITSNVLRATSSNITSILTEYANNVGRLPNVFRALNYLENSIEHISFYKEFIERELDRVFSSNERRIAGSFFITLTDFMMRRNRVYESQKRLEYWNTHINRLEKTIKKFLIKDEKRYSYHK